MRVNKLNEGYSVSMRHIIDEFHNLETTDIIRMLNIQGSSELDTESPMFVLRNGDVVSVAKTLGMNGNVCTHAHLLTELFIKIGEVYDLDADDVEEVFRRSGWEIEEVAVDELDFLLNNLYWARMNCGNTWQEKRFYCVLPFGGTTNSQYAVLEKWLEWGYDHNHGRVLVFVNDDSHYYDLKDCFPEDITKSIKRYYSSGRFYENLTESKADFDKLVNWCGKDLADRFMKLRKILPSPYNDMYRWMYKYPLESFEEFIAEYEQDEEERKQSDKTAREGANLIYKDDNWSVYEILNFKASNKYGKGTKWCISGNQNGERYWNNYVKMGDKFYFYIKTGGEKYALVIHNNGSYTIWNSEDKVVHSVVGAPEVEGLPKLQDQFIIDDNGYLIITSTNIKIALNYINDMDIKKIRFDNSVSEIDDYEFEYAEIESVMFSPSIHSIGYKAFRDCQQLKYVFIPSTVSIIHEFAFVNCWRAVIHCEVDEQPDGYENRWQGYDAKVVFGSKTPLFEDLEVDIDDIKDTLIKVLDEHNYCYYDSTSMCLELICEKLFYEYNIDARYRGRTVYLDNKKLATIEVEKDGPHTVGMVGYKLLI